MRILYQFPLSHFCEKARWLLDHKEIDYVAQNLTPIVHRAFSRIKTNQNTLPIFRDHEEWISDSTKIAEYLDIKYPEKGLIPKNTAMRISVYDLNDIANKLGEHVRRWALYHMILRNDESIDTMIRERGYFRKFSKYSKPILKKFITQNLYLDQHSVDYDYKCILDIVNTLSAQIKQNQSYLVGDRLTLADISICSMLAPLMNIYGTPWEIENYKYDEHVYHMQKLINESNIGQYVKRIYRTERNARVDWRGI